MSAIETFRGDEAWSPARRADAVTPHDTNPLTYVSKGLYIGTGGDVVLKAIGSTADVTYANLADGAYICVRVQYVRATGTTATDIVAES